MGPVNSSRSVDIVSPPDEGCYFADNSGELNAFLVAGHGFDDWAHGGRRRGLAV